MQLDAVLSSLAYLVMVPGVVLSEHNTLAEARSARAQTIKDGYEEPVI